MDTKSKIYIESHTVFQIVKSSFETTSQCVGLVSFVPEKQILINQKFNL